MIKYIVQVEVDADKQLNTTYTDFDGKEKRSFSKIKGWDGKSPLYGVGKSYSTRLTPEIGMALQFSKEEDAWYYCREFTGSIGYYQPVQPILSAQVLKVEIEPRVLEVTREEVAE